MAGGEGSRLRPLTSNQPKPMMPLVNRPMMEHIVGLLKRHGFEEIVVTLAFMPNAIRTYFGDGSECGGRARRALPRDLRRRAHGHRPREDRQLPRRARRAGDGRPRGRREPTR